MSDKPLHVKTSLDKEVRGHAGSLTCRFKHLPQEPRWESPVQMVVRAYASCKVTFLPGVPGSHLTTMVAMVTGVLPWRAHQGARQRHQQLQQECQEHYRLR